MEKKRLHYIVNHMDDFLFEWSLYEYLQISKYMKSSDRSTFILANYDKILHFNDPKFISLNKTNISLLPQSSSLLFLEKDINDYLVEKEDILSFKKEVFPKKRVCLLDFRAEKTLEPQDEEEFDVFIFGGILGDHPPRDRTSTLRMKSYPIRNLGKLQLSTDTAVLVTKLIVENKIPIEKIPFIEEPEFKKEGSNGESIVIEGFRYVSKKIKYEDGKEGEGKEGEVHMHEEIRNRLLFKELDINDFM